MLTFADSANNPLETPLPTLTLVPVTWKTELTELFDCFSDLRGFYPSGMLKNKG